MVKQQTRYLHEQINKDLSKKMVFIGGPRQVGKTTLAKAILLEKTKKLTGYLNWDHNEHREMILNGELPKSSLWVFDEIHKYKVWRNYLKGLFDVKRNEKQILVTGSARLDLYRRGGDSLQGRYHFLRLYPLSFAELKMKNSVDLMELLTLGGFPEPFFSSSAIDAKRWSREYRARVIRDDVSSLEKLEDLGKLELLMLRLPELVASPLSINNLREDLQVSHQSVVKWIDVLEKLFVLFRIPPFGPPKIRALKKLQKHYHYDWTLISNEGAKFESFMACHLLKWVHFCQDTQGKELDLHYFQDRDGHEVDFVITEDKKPIHFIECKLADDSLGKGLIYLSAKFPNVKAWQISATGTKDYLSYEGIRVCPALVFLKELV